MSATATERRCQHRFYLMTCEDFRALEARAGGLCEICRTETKLKIDHDHGLGWGAVRGLLCQKCNSELSRVDAGHQEPGLAVAEYLANSWYLQTQTPLPASEQTPIRAVRIPDDVWEALRAAAARNDETAADVLRRAAETYVRRNK